MLLRALSAAVMAAVCTTACQSGDNHRPSTDAGPDDVLDDGGTPNPDDPDGMGAEGDASTGAHDPCPSLFHQDLLPEWHVTLSDQEWDELVYEFYNREQNDAANLPINPYHPVEHISYDDGSGPVEVENVLIRLKGQSSWLHTVKYDPNPKMQFVLAFNEVNPDGRFKGVRKVELDMPRTDWTFMRQRMALHILREVGQDAQCANNAKLYINGEYYGLYTHLERLDKEFLQRIYGKANNVDDGDLWKSGSIIKTNEDSHTVDRIMSFWSANSVDSLAGLADLDDAVHEWASEAILPHADGYYIGRHNYYLYDHPQRGFLWLPHDLDTAFDYYSPELDAVYPACINRDYKHWGPYATVLADPTWMGKYIDTLNQVEDAFDVDEHAALIETWSEQIEEAAEDDDHKPFSMGDHQWALGEMHEHLYLRADFIDDWLACRETGSGDDWDGDGAIFCYDCDDTNSSVHPGRAESCNGVDDDCDGFLDEGC